MDFKEFLVKAKINTYATAGEGGEKVLDDGGKELIYEKDGFKYRDGYFGFNPFVGEEVVWKNNEFIWGMNYYGKVTSDIISGKEVYNFLKKALRRVEASRPFRGPAEFKEKDFEYINENEGGVEDFSGIEKIFHKGHEVYKLYYHGGTVKKK